MSGRMGEFVRGVRQMARKRNPQSILSLEGTSEIRIDDVDLMLNRPYALNGIPLFSYVYHEYVPLMGGDGKIGVSHPEAELMLHARNFVIGNQSLIMCTVPEYDFGVNPNYPIFTLLRNLVRAQRTYARPYQVLGTMLKPVELTTAKIKTDVWLPPGKEVIDPPTVDVPAVMSSVWRSPAGKTGYVLVNWTSKPEEARLGLVKKEGAVLLVTAAERNPVPDEAVKSGRINTAVILLA
jgi:hypothetical protein